MSIARRHALILSAALLAYGPLGAFPSIAAAPSGRSRGRVALLAPLSGGNAPLGRSMLRAAALLQGKDKDRLPVFDTATDEGAAGAATRALREGARLIVGPLTAAETREVIAAVGDKAPVLSLSNDPALEGQGAFLLGVTPSQSTGAILDYARSRGVRRVAVAMPGGDSPWARGVLAEAMRLRQVLGLDVTVLSDPASDDPAQGTDADALLVADGGAAAIDLARRCRARGLQCLGTLQLLDRRPDAMAALDGAWLAAPDPAAFQGFARDYAREGDDPGLIAALAHDGLSLALQLAGGGGGADRAGLLALGRFAGATGNLRFRADGACIREMAILLARPSGFETVDRRAAA